MKKSAKRRAHASYVPMCLSIFYRLEHYKLKTLYPYVFKGTEFNFGPHFAVSYQKCGF